MEKTTVLEPRPETSLGTNASLNYTTVHNRKFWYSVLKRIGDVFFSILALILLSPLLIIVTILICLEDHHNPFYVQDRVGLNGRVFRIYKFRTMRVNSHAQRNALLSQNEDQGANFSMTNDPRVTKIGIIERDSAKGVLHYGSEEELYKMSPYGLYEYEQEQQEAEYRALLRKAMYMALSDLQEWNPHWYELVTEYYLSEPRPTLEQVGERYGVSRQAVTKSIRKGMTVLRCHANMHLAELLNE